MAKSKAITKTEDGGALLPPPSPEELAQLAKDAIGHGRVGVLRVSIKGGQLKIGDDEIKNNKINVIILDTAFENAWYKDDWEDGAPVPPTCYALSRNDENMVPHDQSEEKQSDTCASCEKNKFGSADKGRGKACRNIRRIALLSADTLSVKAVQEGDLAYLKIPPTSAKGFAKYAIGLAGTQQLPPQGVVTELGVEMEKTYPIVRFRYVERLESRLLSAVLARKRAEAELIIAPYPQRTEEDERPAKKTGKRKY